jgi:hypothetical protein
VPRIAALEAHTEAKYARQGTRNAPIDTELSTATGSDGPTLAVQSFLRVGVLHITGIEGIGIMSNALHLRFLATGDNQHVFVDRDQTQCQWVYKIPSAFGYILPWDHPRRLKRQPPRGRLKLFAYRQLFAPSPAVAGRNAGSKDRWTPDTRLEWAWAQYIRWNSARRFKRMCQLMEVLSERGGRDLLVPYQVNSGTSAVLYVEDRALPWSGTLLMQRRIEFRSLKQIIEHGQWETLIEAQHRLWRHGIAVADVVRYTSWVLYDGQPRLADGDSLTDSLKIARTHVSPAILDLEASIIRRRVKGVRTEPLEEYQAYMSAHISQRMLAQLWRTDIQN